MAGALNASLRNRALSKTYKNAGIKVEVGSVAKDVK